MPTSQESDESSTDAASVSDASAVRPHQNIIVGTAILTAILVVVLIFSAAARPIPKTAAQVDANLQAQANQVAVRAGCPKSPTARVNTMSWKTAPAMTITKTATYYARVATTAGSFVIKLDTQAAPVTVNNFVFLAQQGFYHCVTFHRVIPGFVAQGGDPIGTGTGGPGYSFKDELPKAGSLTYPLYSVSMANAGPNTNGSQFFIVVGKYGETLPASYSLFGQVVSGQKVVATIGNEGTPGTGMPPRVIQRMLSVAISSNAS